MVGNFKYYYDLAGLVDASGNINATGPRDKKIDFDDLAALARLVAKQDATFPGGGSGSLEAAYARIDAAVEAEAKLFVPEPANWLLLTIGASAVLLGRFFRSSTVEVWI